MTLSDGALEGGKLIRYVLLAIAVVWLAPVAHSQPHPDQALLRIGSLDGADRETFGQIADVAVDARGNIFVLDAQALEIRWFDSSGAYRGRGARKGRGPGELLQPTSMVIGSNGRILILDQWNRRISEYEVGDTRLTHTRDIRLRYRATDFCTLGGRIFTVGAQAQPKLIQEIDTSGHVINSFGKREQPPADVLSRLGSQAGSILQAEYNNAVLHCDSATTTVFVAYVSMPLIRAYSGQGELLWQRDIGDFDTPSPGLAHEGALSWTFNAQTKRWSSTVAITTDNRANLFVSVYTLERGAEGGWADVRTLRSQDGVAIGRSTGPDILATASGPYLYGFHQLPFPQVVKYRSPTR